MALNSVVLEVLRVVFEARDEFSMMERPSVCLWGPPGWAKSTTCRVFAKRIGYETVTVFTGAADSPGDLVGMPFVYQGEMKIIPPDWLTLVMETQGKCIIIWDEFNRANMLVQQMLHPTLLEGRVGPHRMPQGVMQIAACNPPSQVCFVNELDHALVDRMLHIMMPVDFDGWMRWFSKRAHENILSYLIASGQQIFSGQEQATNPRTHPTPRSITMFNTLYKSSGATWSVEVMTMIATGLLGDRAGRALVAALTSATQPIPPSKILEAYQSVRGEILVWAAPTTHRADLLEATLKLLVYTLRTKKSLSDTEMRNLTRLYKDLPKDQQPILLDQLPGHIEIKGISKDGSVPQKEA